MPSFKSILNQHGVSDAHRESILRMVRDYRDDGLSAQEAQKKVLADLSADVDKQIQDVSNQIHGRKNG